MNMQKQLHDLAQETFQMERDLEQTKKDIEWILMRHENDEIRCRFCIHWNPKIKKCIWDGSMIVDGCVFEYGHRMERDYGNLPFEDTDCTV